LEEGEIPAAAVVVPATEGDEKPPEATEKKKTARQIAEEERQARRRMLGNMQFIGQLYKYSLLTERIMHNCVIQLLAVSENSVNRVWSRDLFLVPDST
jgi:translation initiation factor 4G